MKINKGTVLTFLKKNSLILLIGAAAIVLLCLLGDAATNKKTETVASSETLESNYAAAKQSELKSILEKIDGVGKCEIMISLAGGYENNYAVDVDGEKSEYAVVGGKTVLIGTKSPKIEGVLVACSGGDSSSVKSNIINIVSSLFSVEKNKICVSKLK